MHSFRRLIPHNLSTQSGLQSISFRVKKSLPKDRKRLSKFKKNYITKEFCFYSITTHQLFAIKSFDFFHIFGTLVVRFLSELFSNDTEHAFL